MKKEMILLLRKIIIKNFIKILLKEKEKNY